MHASLADVMADTVQNSLEAGARHVSVDLVEEGGTISVAVVDDGKGMDAATLARAFDPFYSEPGKHDKRRVGLGLPILKQMCEACGGACELESTPGKGTTLRYSLDASNVDLPPMGDVVAAMTTLFNFPGDAEIKFIHRRGGESYSVSRSELADAVGGLDSVEGLSLAKEYLAAQEGELPPLVHEISAPSR